MLTDWISSSCSMLHLVYNLITYSNSPRKTKTLKGNFWFIFRLKDCKTKQAFLFHNILLTSIIYYITKWIRNSLSCKSKCEKIAHRITLIHAKTYEYEKLFVGQIRWNDCKIKNSDLNPIILVVICVIGGWNDATKDEYVKGG